MSIPIVFTHKTNSDYLLLSLSQAKKTNPKSQIYLIGDCSNNYYRFVQHHNIIDYFKDAGEFSKNYQHLNTNPYAYELFCFQRWFILRSFMTSNNIKSCLYIDSDAMLYTDISLESKNFEQYDFTLSYPPLVNSPSPHCVLINRVEALSDFCDFLNEIYLDTSLLKVMRLQFDKYAGYGGGACDMTAFREYQNSGRSKIGNTSTILDDSVYDHNINESNGFEMCKGIKNIYWMNGKPFCKLVDSEKKINFKIIHFQGGAKAFMKDYCTDRSAVARYYVRHYFQRLQNKATKLKKQVYKFF